MTLAENLASVQKRIGLACARVGRSPGEVVLLPVSKGHPPEAVAAIAALGVTQVGESRVQEARAKIPLCPGHVRWHMIGHLQSNKCREAVQLFDLIHSVDSLQLAAELARWAERATRRVAILLEANVAGEASKFGYAPDRLLAEIEAINRLPRIEVHGLMTMAPYTTETERVRAVFRQLRELREACQERLGAPLPHLSMGMSSDFEIGIEEGATIIRVGTRIFGPRVSSFARPGPGAAEGEAAAP
jgi:hypothetical protein